MPTSTASTGTGNDPLWQAWPLLPGPEGHAFRHLIMLALHALRSSEPQHVSCILQHSSAHDPSVGPLSVQVLASRSQDCGRREMRSRNGIEAVLLEGYMQGAVRPLTLPPTGHSVMALPSHQVGPQKFPQMSSAPAVARSANASSVTLSMTASGLPAGRARPHALARVVKSLRVVAATDCNTDHVHRGRCDRARDATSKCIFG